VVVVSDATAVSAGAGVASVASVAAAVRFRGFRTGWVDVPASAAGSGLEMLAAGLRGGFAAALRSVERAGAAAWSAAAFRTDRRGAWAGASTTAGIAGDVVSSGRAFGDSVLADEDSATASAGGTALRAVRRAGFTVAVAVSAAGRAGGFAIVGSALGVAALGADAFGVVGRREAGAADRRVPLDAGGEAGVVSAGSASTGRPEGTPLVVFDVSGCRRPPFDIAGGSGPAPFDCPEVASIGRGVNTVVEGRSRWIGHIGRSSSTDDGRGAGGAWNAAAGATARFAGAGATDGGVGGGVGSSVPSDWGGTIGGRKSAAGGEAGGRRRDVASGSLLRAESPVSWPMMVEPSVRPPRSLPATRPFRISVAAGLLVAALPGRPVACILDRRWSHRPSGRLRLVRSMAPHC
jgi:hypothetical protein